MICRCELRKRIKEAAVPWIPDRTVYMDYNATTPVDPRTIGAFERACRRNWGNPSSLHTAGISGWTELGNLRETAADFFGSESEGFHLCSSGTAALSTAIFGLAAKYPDLTFITTEIEHQAIRHPLFHLKRRSPAAPQAFNGDVVSLPVDGSGKLDPASFRAALKKARRAALVVSPVNHETGNVQPVKDLAAVAADFGAMVVLDGVQAAARLEPEQWAPYCDLFCISGHKLYAPKGTALFWFKPGLRIHPLLFGGSQEGRLFPGTENVPGAAALTEALKLMKHEWAAEQQMLTSLIKDGIAILEKNGPGFTVESPAGSVPGVLCISLHNIPDMEKLIFGLNEMNICLSRFSACSERLDGPSKILTAMGRPAERASSSIRISLGRWSKRDDFFKLAKALKRLV